LRQATTLFFLILTFAFPAHWTVVYMSVIEAGLLRNRGICEWGEIFENLIAVWIKQI